MCPPSLELPVAAPRPLLACGAELKNTFCVAKGARAWVSHHIGDLENYETLRTFTEGIEHFERLFAVAPEIVAHDLHPEYLSTKYALERDGVELVAVQHHHAHLAACLAEHGETGPAIGAIFDGTGYGTDGTVWGGELLVGGLDGFERAGHLRPVRLPGGAQRRSASRGGWRARGWSRSHGREIRRRRRPIAVGGRPARRGAPCRELARDRARVAGDDQRRAAVRRGRRALRHATARQLRGPGGGRARGRSATRSSAAAYPLPLARDGGRIVLDARPTVVAVVDDLAAGAPVARVAARFHNALAAATTAACIELAVERDMYAVALSGGSFQNRVLLERVATGLRNAGMRVLIPERLPPSDGGISYGQAAVAAAVAL